MDLRPYAGKKVVLQLKEKYVVQRVVDGEHLTTLAFAVVPVMDGGRQIGQRVTGIAADGDEQTLPAAASQLVGTVVCLDGGRAVLRYEDKSGGPRILGAPIPVVDVEVAPDLIAFVSTVGERSRILQS